MDYKYKVGQRVRVRNDLTVRQTYRMRSGPDYKNTSNCVNEEMMQLRGKFVHIEATDCGQYLLK